MVSTAGTSFFVTPPAWSALGDLTLRSPIFVIGSWPAALPEGMVLPPVHASSGLAGFFADGTYLGQSAAGRGRVASLRLAPAGEPSAGPAEGPRFPTPLNAKRYVEYGWALYWRTADERTREGIIGDIRGVSQFDINCLVDSWERRKPFAYDAVFGFALAGHRYARQKFIEGILKKARAKGDEPVKIIMENIKHGLGRVWTTRDEEEHRNMYYAVRGLVLVLCSMASDGDKEALRAVNGYLATLSELAGRLRGQPDPGRLVSRAVSEADTFLKEADYLLSEVNPNKFLDDPAGNRNELDFLARNRNMRVLEAYAHYAMRGDVPAVLTVLNTALTRSDTAIFDLLMPAAVKRPCILLFMFVHEESGLRELFAEMYEHAQGAGRDGPFSIREIHKHVMMKFKEFDFSGVSFDCENPAHEFETAMLMAFLGNRGAIESAAELTGRLIAHGGAYAFEDNGASFLRASLIYIIEAASSGCEEANTLIRNLAALGHEGARQHVANGRKPDKKLS